MAGIDKYSIWLGYFVFVSAVLMIEYGIGFSAMTGAMPTANTYQCKWSNPVGCIVNGLNFFFALFSLNSSIGWFNSLFLIPFIALTVWIIVEIARGVG